MEIIKEVRSRGEGIKEGCVKKDNSTGEAEQKGEDKRKTCQGEECGREREKMLPGWATD